MTKYDNVSYIFIPFIYEKAKDFESIIAKLDGSAIWDKTHDEIRYMYKYVADKIMSSDRKQRQCFHYELNAGNRNLVGLANTEAWYATELHEYTGNGEKTNIKFRFQIVGAHLYCFSTSVGIMAIAVHLEENDPLWISSAQYYLKKVSKEQIHADGDESNGFTFLELAQKLIEQLNSVSKFDFFYYANEGNERSNILTYLEVQKKADYKKELYYLRRCYKTDGFMYMENEESDKKEIYMPSKDTVWGITSEAAVCLACPEEGREEFITKTFYKNFNAQYLFMYILLLHQKYVLYMFLIKTGVGTYNNLEALEEYRNQLYEFEADFAFSRVTEVPQYQSLYDRMTEAFMLKQMFEDVHEPLKALGEIRREANENAQKERDDNVNRALMMLSILSFFSALADSYAFTEDFVTDFGGKLMGAGLVGLIVQIIQGVCVAGIIIIVMYVFIKLIKSKRDKKRR